MKKIFRGLKLTLPLWGLMFFVFFTLVPDASASDSCSYDMMCSDSYSGCRYCSSASAGGTLASSAPGYFVGGSVSAKCDNTSGCSVDVKCWNSSGPWKEPISSTVPTKVECCNDSDCDDGNECTYDSCNSSFNCVHTNASNGTSCGLNVCYNGSCVDEDTNSAACIAAGGHYDYFGKFQWFGASAHKSCCFDEISAYERYKEIPAHKATTMGECPNDDTLKICRGNSICLSECGTPIAESTWFHPENDYWKGSTETTDFLDEFDCYPHLCLGTIAELYRAKNCNPGYTCNSDNKCVLEGSAPPTLSFSAITPINLSDPTTLTYDVSGAISCDASTSSPGAGNWGGPVAFSDTPPSHSYNVVPDSAGTKTYTLACSNLAGTTTKSATVVVNDPAPGTSIDGVCGGASRTYSYSETGFNGDSFCYFGTANPTNPPFPDPGKTSSWYCLGIDGGNSSSECKAIHESTPDPGWKEVKP